LSSLGTPGLLFFRSTKALPSADPAGAAPARAWTNRLDLPVVFLAALPLTQKGRLRAALGDGMGRWIVYEKIVFIFACSVAKPDGS
jgi:hypothetical protein